MTCRVPASHRVGMRRSSQHPAQCAQGERTSGAFRASMGVRGERPAGKGAREEGPCHRGSRRVDGPRPDHGWPGHLRRRGPRVGRGRVERETFASSSTTDQHGTGAHASTRPAPRPATRPDRAKGKGGGRYHVPTGAYFNDPRGGWPARMRIERQVMRAIKATEKGSVIRIAQ